MSRTDAHRPREVWIKDHPELRIEHHNHIDGVCTIDAPSATFSRESCWVELSPYVSLCSCELCSGRTAKKKAERARRRIEHNLCRLAKWGATEEELEAAEANLKLSWYSW